MTTIATPAIGLHDPIEVEQPDGSRVAMSIVLDTGDSVRLRVRIVPGTRRWQYPDAEQRRKVVDAYLKTPVHVGGEHYSGRKRVGQSRQHGRGTNTSWYFNYPVA